MKPKKKKVKPRPLEPHILALMVKVKAQLENLNRPVQPEEMRVAANLPELTVQDCRAMDPLADSTMTGECTGRLVQNPKFQTEYPTASGILDWIKADLKKWPWRRKISV